MKNYHALVYTYVEIAKAKRKIEELRIKLYEKAAGRPFTDSVVLKASQKLNRMLNKYERLISKIK